MPLTVFAARIDVNALTNPNGTFTIQPGQTAYFGLRSTTLTDQRLRFSIRGLDSANDLPDMRVSIGDLQLQTYTGTGPQTTNVNGVPMRWDMVYLDAFTPLMTGDLFNEVTLINVGDTPFVAGISGRSIFEPIALSFISSNGGSWGQRAAYIQLEALQDDNPPAHAPEPGTFVLLSTGCAAVYFTRRYRNTPPAPSRLSLSAGSERTS